MNSNGTQDGQINEDENDFEKTPLGSLTDIIDDIYERYKPDPDADLSSIVDVFQIYGIEDSSKMNPSTITSIYHSDMGACNRAANELKDGYEEEYNKIESMIKNLLQKIHYQHETIMSFMKGNNISAAFPALSQYHALTAYKTRDIEEYTPAMKLFIFILGKLQSSNLRRVKSIQNPSNADIYQMKIVDNHPTNSWVLQSNLQTFMMNNCNKETNHEMWMANFNWMEKSRDRISIDSNHEFPDLIPTRRVWSFRKGVYNATDDTYHRYDAPTRELDEFVACKYFDMDFQECYFKDASIGSKKTYDDIKTPSLDQIFKFQQWDDEMIKWMFVFIGRMFYDVNERDTWQVIPFLKGVAGTGKSSIINVILNIFDPKDVGILSNNVEEQFGLSPIADKLNFVAPEVKKDFSINQATFQSMVTGENVSLAVKNGAPINMIWTIPGMLAGNEAPGWEDKSGSIARRVTVLDFPYATTDADRDPTLGGRIKKEIPAIIRKSSLAYDWATSAYGDSDIWSVLPQRMCESKEKLQYSTNLLYAFLKSANVEIEGTKYSLESQFITSLREFATNKFPSSSKFTFTEDFYSMLFSQYKITVVQETRNWPQNTNNPQYQTYIDGCRLTQLK